MEEMQKAKSCITVTVMNSRVDVRRHARKIKDKHIVTVLELAVGSNQINTAMINLCSRVVCRLSLFLSLFFISLSLA